jgi:hypothetical protein
VMDAIRSAEPPAAEPSAAEAPATESAKTGAPVPAPAPIEVAKLAAARAPRIALFTDIAVGDAP